IDELAVTEDSLMMIFGELATS
ncbi:MAG: hypothetical protein JWQ28_27, partial [Pedobacter sp.]|nr:hypothetical protein [Pedobacter sp.]